MSILAQTAADPFLTEAEGGASSDKELLNIEFKELSERLSSLIDMQLNGRRLFGGIKTDFTQGCKTGTTLPQQIYPKLQQRCSSNQRSNYIRFMPGWC